jgi:hypothetical protein
MFRSASVSAISKLCSRISPTSSSAKSGARRDHVERRGDVCGGSHACHPETENRVLEI